MKLSFKSLLVAAFAGAVFSGIGVTFRLGDAHGVRPRQILMVLCIVGAVAFAIRGLLLRRKVAPPEAAALTGRSARVRMVGLAVIAAGAQWAMIRLAEVALDLGPLTPYFCAVSLGFVPLVVYSGAVFRERVGRWQVLSMIAAVLCVVASAGSQSPSAGIVPSGLLGGVLYGLALAGLVVTNGATNAAFKHMGVRPAGGQRSYMDVYRNPFYALFYFLLGIMMVIDLCVTGTMPANSTWLWAMGGLAGLCSVAGIFAISTVISAPAALVFTASGVSGIVSTALIAVTFLGEPANGPFFATVGLGVAAIALNSRGGAA